MSGPFLFEAPYRGYLWRLEVSTFRGNTFANWRRWYRKEGEWLPGQEGCTFPLDALWELTEALIAHHGLTPPSVAKRVA